MFSCAGCGSRAGFSKCWQGPGQVGKTTLASQVMEEVDLPSHYASSDEPALKGREWLAQQWEIGRLKAREGKALLVLDEIQKVYGW